MADDRVIRYAPIDWIYSRPHGRVIADAGTEPLALAKFLDKGPRAFEDGELLLGALRYSRDRLNEATTPPSHNAAEWEGIMVQAVRQFCEAGRNVFHFDRAMTDSLRNVDLGDAAVEDLVHPYESYYLRFDGAEHVLPNGEILDGVLITRRDVTEGGAATMAKAVSARLSELDEMDDDALVRAMDSIRDELGIVRLLVLDFMPKGHGHWPDVWQTGYHYELEMADPAAFLVEALAHAARNPGFEIRRDGETTDWATPLPDIKQWAALVVNAILYVTRYAGDHKPEWQPDAPADLVRTANDGKRTAGKELVRRGFARTRFVRFGGGDESDTAGDGTVRPHWRRAHWKRQPHGPGRSLRKLILVAATRVAWKDVRDHSPTHGRSYVVTQE